MIIRAIAALCCAAVVAGPALAGDYRLLRLEGHELKWGVPERGVPAEVTYRLVDRPHRFARAINCGSLGPIDPLLARSGISAADFRAELEAAFAAWTAVAGIKFVPVESGPADILIGAQAIPRGRAYTNVEYDTTGAIHGIAGLTRSLICFNPDQGWKIGFDGNLDSYDIRYVLIHEIGHAIGLNHADSPRSLMYHAYDEAFRLPQTGDIAGAVTIYGEPAGPALAGRERKVPSTTAKADGRSLAAVVEPRG